MNKLFGVTQPCLKKWKRKWSCTQVSSQGKASWILGVRAVVLLLKFGMCVLQWNVLSEKQVSMKPYFRNIFEREAFLLSWHLLLSLAISHPGISCYFPSLTITIIIPIPNLGVHAFMQHTFICQLDFWYRELMSWWGPR